MSVSRTKKKKSPKKKKPAAASKVPKKKKKKSSGSKDGKADFNAKGLGKAWNDARESDGSMEDTELEPGDYVGQITSARAGNDGKGQPYFALSFTITRGDMKGSTVSAYYGLHNEGAQKVFVGQLQALGFVTKKLDASDIPELAKTISKDKAKVRLQVKHTIDGGRSFQNCYIRGLIDED